MDNTKMTIAENKNPTFVINKKVCEDAQRQSAF